MPEKAKEATGKVIKILDIENEEDVNILEAIFSAFTIDCVKEPESVKNIELK